MNLYEVWPYEYEIIEDRGPKKRMLTSGKIQHYGVRNANGRRYSKEIMEREVGKLIPLVEDRSVLGELDHPCLTSPDFRVLTSDGWKEFRDVHVGDQVWSRVEGKAHLSVVQAITDEPYNGRAYRVQGRSIDSGFTPNHRLVLVDRPDRVDRGVAEKHVTLREVVASPDRFGHHAIPKTAEWGEGEVYPDQVRIPAVLKTGSSGVVCALCGETFETISPTHLHGSHAMEMREYQERFPDRDLWSARMRVQGSKSNVAEDLVLSSGVFAAFMGIYLSEGSCSPSSTDNYNVSIHQKTEWSRRLIKEEILDKFPFSWSEHRNGFTAADARLYFYLKRLGNVYSKFVPKEVKTLSPSDLQEFLFWYTVGDGRVTVAEGIIDDLQVPDGMTFKEALHGILRSECTVENTRTDVHSVSEELVRGLHECLVRTGRSGIVSRIDPKSDYTFAGRTIKAENKVPLFQLRFSNTRSIWMDPRYLRIEEFHHSGNVYCLTVDHGNFYMEQNGKAFWTGNSDGKTKLARVSHLWVNLKILDDGRVLGESEILNTPRGLTLQALYRDRVKIGCSSRGQGSVNSKTGDVSNDFALETFDKVHKPSTPDAYMDLIREEHEAVRRLTEDEEEGHKRLSEVRRLVLEHASSFRDLDKIERVELGSFLAHGEFAARRLVVVPSLRELAEETLSISSDLRSKIEEGLGVICNQGICRVPEGAARAAVTVPDLGRPAMESREDKTVDRRDDSARRNENMSDLSNEVQRLTESLKANNDEMAVLRKKDEQHTAALKLIETMKARLEASVSAKTEAEERATAAERLLTEATSRLRNMDTQQSTGLRRRLSHAENLIAHLADRTGSVDESELEERDVVIEAAERLGDALIRRISEVSRQEAETSRRAHAAEDLLRSTLETIKSDRIKETVEDLLNRDPNAAKIRPIMENTEYGSVDEARMHYARLRSLSGRRGDPTLPLGDRTDKAPVRGTITESQQSSSGDRMVDMALDVASRLGGV